MLHSISVVMFLALSVVGITIVMTTAGIWTQAVFKENTDMPVHVALNIAMTFIAAQPLIETVYFIYLSLIGELEITQGYDDELEPGEVQIQPAITS